MKVRINISISEEANTKLNKQTNKSEYIENLILGGSGQEDTLTKILNKLDNLQYIEKPESKGSGPHYENSREDRYNQLRDCTCPFENGERQATELNCPIHDPSYAEEIANA
jgi:hypothetical protein